MPTWMMTKKVGDLTLCGYSVAGVETVVGAPELNVCFDIGRAPSEIVPIDNICLTHGHMDHAGGLAYYLSHRGFIGNAPGRIIVHRKLAQAVQALLGVWADIEGHHTPGVILGVEAGQDVAIRRDLFVRPFDVNHGACALGFSVIEVRRKLKPEFAGRSGPQLVELKKQGVEIQSTVEVPLVSYCGDTAIGRFLDLEHVRSAGVLIIECTFFDRDHVSRARDGRHLHVSDLPKVMERTENPHVVLTHFTQRTDMRAAKQIIAGCLPPADLERITILMDRPPRRDRERGT